MTDLSLNPNFEYLTQPGRFVVGCNYWASHAGTAMWSKWDQEVVEQDFRQLAAAGLQVLRVFPLWPDFQPIKLLRGGAGAPVEFRLGELPLEDDVIGRAGVAKIALERFGLLADLAERYGLKLIVGLVTGWMSGRLFVPPGLDGLNVLTDPVAMQWEIRLVRSLVRHLKNHPAILAWDLGNECNCMAQVPNRQAAWLWTAAITDAIRVEDQSRPVVSGMHSLLPDRGALWTMQDQAELTDLLTTHPYPYFTPHCDQDPANTIRTILHSTAESRFYADIGGKPCLAEEIGTLGPILASESKAADFIRACLFSLWANDCHGLLWWCAFDQLHLDQAPYDWAACERELGLIRKDGTEKPVMKVIGDFKSWLGKLPIKTLPTRLTEAVCILTEGQDAWAAAYSSFILAKQAGFDLEFQYSDQPLKPSNLYLMPSVNGMSAISRRRWLELLDKVHSGATLYLSHADCLLSPFNEAFGLEVQTRQRRNSPARINIAGLDETLVIESPVRLNLEVVSAEVIGQEADGNPAFTRACYGKGSIYFLSVPLEESLANQPGAFHAPNSPDYWRIYSIFANAHLGLRAARKYSSMLGLTEHPLNEKQRLLVAINYSPDQIESTIGLSPGWSCHEIWYGTVEAGNEALHLNLPPDSAAVIMVEQKIDTRN